MKNLFLSVSLATLSLLPLGCKKSEADVDPRDQYAGTYLVSGTQSVAAVSLKTGVGTLYTSNVVNAKVVVSKGSASDEMMLVVDGNPSLTMKMESNTFFMLPTYVQDKTATGYSYYKMYDGRGSFINNKINLTTILTGKTDQVDGRSDTNVSGSKQ